MLALAFACLYLAFPTRQFYWDGIAFAILIEHARTWRELFNVHHLLYNFIGCGEYRLLGGAVRALYLMQWTNCVAGACLVWLAFRMFRSLDVPEGNSAACAAMVGAAATFWKFTTDADSYLLSNLFLVAAYLALRRSVTAAASLHLAAILMHQLAVLFYPAALVYLWRRSHERFLRDAVLYTAISAGGTLAIYRLAFSLALHPEARDFGSWLTFHAQVPFFFHPARSLGWLLLGSGRLFVGGRLSRGALMILPLVISLAAFGLTELVRQRNKLSSVSQAVPLVVWCLCCFSFLIVWEPYNTFYRLFYLVPSVGLLALSTRAIRARPLVLIASALLCWNFVAFIYPNSRPENNRLLTFALQQRADWPPGTGIIFSRFVSDLWTISYFNPQVAWITVEDPDPVRVASYNAQFEKAGRHLYLDWTYLERSGHPVPGLSFLPADRFAK